MLSEHCLHNSLGKHLIARLVCTAAAIILVIGVAGTSGLGLFAQGNTTGKFQGVVKDKNTNLPIPGATIVLRNIAFDAKSTLISAEDGTFGKGSLYPGEYEIVVSATGYETISTKQTLGTMATFQVEPVPFYLGPVKAAPVVAGGDPSPTPAPTVTTVSGEPRRERANFDLNPRRGGIFGPTLVTGLPLGGTTLTRTFDELAFFVPGVNPPPQSIGNGSGPGQGPGVGSAGQFSINGLRSRANNFTVDGSDNNDEDIGVRRQGFFSLVPQPLESIQEFQIITLLAPAEFGRNLGAQVNAVSRSGGNNVHGSIYGFYNSDTFNARNSFDTIGNSATTTTNLTAIQTFNNGTSRIADVFLDGNRVRVTNFAGGEDPLTYYSAGGAVGGPIIPNKMFFFVSGEYQKLNGSTERHYAVPTVEQRGLLLPGQGSVIETGSTGVVQCQGTLTNGVCSQPFTPGFPTSIAGDAVFSLFPFANDPSGIFGRNTYTQEQSIDARGRIFSGKIDWNLFSIRGNQQTLTVRYNDTDDRRDLPDVGGALFSAIRPKVRTHNLSAYLNGSLSSRSSNELRFSFGRTRLDFDEIRDPFLSDITRNFNPGEDSRFLLSAPRLFNVTIPGSCTTLGCTAPNAASYVTAGTTEGTVDDGLNRLGPIGQLIIPGFSPVGVDVFNFPQKRKNDTYQIADTFRLQRGQHGFAIGTDIRRVFLDSDLPRNSRPLVSFNGSLRPSFGDDVPFTSPLTLASSGAATGFFQSLVLPGSDSRIELSYNQFNLFAQDEWRPSNNFSLHFGLRYELNTVPKEKNRKIEDTFQAARELFPCFPGDGNPNACAGIDTFAGFQAFLDGRRKIYDVDTDNLAPRIGFAWSPVDEFVFRGGYGMYYDQIIGSVVSQSRNVFPTFTTLNTGGGDMACSGNFDDLTRIGQYTFLNPITTGYATTNCAATRFIVAPGTLNVLNVGNNPGQFGFRELLDSLLAFFPLQNGTFFGATIPRRQLDSPNSHQFSFEIEKRLFANTFLSVGYVGTVGRNLLRFTTPNLGSNYIGLLTDLTLINNQPTVFGTTFDVPFRPNANIGAINQFETTGKSRYDSIQVEMRGRLLANRFNYRMNYVYGKALDDASDVFDLAGSSALPQNSITPSGEYTVANFDVTHRFSSNFVYDVPSIKEQGAFLNRVLSNWQVAGSARFNTGQPFTVNSIFDVNLDGNLTDRLDNTQFITVQESNSQPLIRTCQPGVQCGSMLAQVGSDGAIERNSFRAGQIFYLDMSFSRRFGIGEDKDLQFRVDVFNFTNHENFGIPVRFLESPGFGRATDTVTPGRRVQFGLKFNF